MAIHLLAALPSVGVKAANRYPSCQLCWDGACDDSSREETGKSSQYHTPRHHKNLVGEQQDEAFLASCIIYYTEKSSLINTFTCLFYYLWLMDDNFHTPWIQPCFFCHVTVHDALRSGLQPAQFSNWSHVVGICAKCGLVASGLYLKISLLSLAA